MFYLQILMDVSNLFWGEDGSQWQIQDFLRVPMAIDLFPPKREVQKVQDTLGSLFISDSELPRIPRK